MNDNEEHGDAGDAKQGHLAETLWPVLEEKVENQRNRKVLPVVDIIDRVIQVANEVRVAREMAVDE